MYKKPPCFLILPLIGVCFLFVCCAAPGPKKVSLDPEGERILDLLGYIILPVEEKILRELPQEDRKEFVDDFWVRRDPNQETPENEYRQIYYTRMATADKAFKAGKPGWKTDRGRIYILLGPPTNVIQKSMGDMPSPVGDQQENPLERGTRTERATEIWIYDQYQEQFGEPLRLIFVDYHSTGDYKLTSKEQLTPYVHSSTWDNVDLAKYQLMGEIETDIKERSRYVIFDYDVAAQVVKGEVGPSALVRIDIPYSRLAFSEGNGNYFCDILISADIRDIQKTVITRKEEPFSQSFSKENLKSLIANSTQIHKEWNLDLPSGAAFIYVSITDQIRGKTLRKLLKVKTNETA